MPRAFGFRSKTKAEVFASWKKVSCEAAIQNKRRSGRITGLLLTWVMMFIFYVRHDEGGRLALESQQNSLFPLFFFSLTFRYALHASSAQHGEEF